jgi:hypothetical protein
MSLIVPENTRQPWSEITNTEILRPKDELRVVGIGFTAMIGVLDSHDPSNGDTAIAMQALGLGDRVLPDHHHILFQFEGSDEIIPTGLFVGQGAATDLLFPHVRYSIDDDAARMRLRRVAETVRDGALGIYFMSDNEQLSAMPQGQLHLLPDGSLLR